MSVETTNLGAAASWRAGAGRGVDPAGRFWRRGPMAQAGGPAGRRTAALAGLAVVLGVGLAVNLWVFSLLRLPRPARLVLVGAGYRSNLQIPQNATGWAGLRDLARLGDYPPSSWLARLCGARYHRAGDPILLDARARDRWAEALRNVPEPTIVVVMAMHGAVDRQGAYLLPDDADAVPDSTERLRMTDVLRTLAGLPRHKKKVLILDATGLPYHWELGMLRNDFAAELVKLEPQIVEIPNLLVIAASGPGERSWTSEAWGRSAFLHFLTEALMGRSAGATATASWSPGARLNLEVVCDDVSARLRSWAAQHRGAGQQPLILPSADVWRDRARSIELPPIREGPNPAPAATDGGEERAIEAAVLGRWDDYRQLAATTASPGVAMPVLWRRYQHILRRYDELLRAVGTADDRDYGDIAAALDAQRADLRAGRSSRLAGAPSANLVMPVVEGVAGADGAPMDPAAPEPDVVSWFEKIWWPSPEDQDRRLWQARKETLSGDAARDQAAQLGGLLLDRAIDDPAGNLDRAARRARLLDQSPQRPAELNFLIMLAPGLPPDWKSPAVVELVRRALRLRRLAERAALGLADRPAGPGRIAAGPSVSAWVGSKVEEGDRHRREAEDLLMASDRRGPAAAAFDRAERAYAAAIQAAGKVRRAILAREVALSDLVPISEWLAAWYPTPDQVELLGELVDSAADLWRKAHALGRALETPDFAAIDGGPAAVGVDLAAAEVEGAHARLRARIEDRLNLWLREVGDSSQAHRSAAELRALVDALTLPWLGRELRIAILRDGLGPLRRRDREERANGGETAQSSTVPGAVDDDDPLIEFRRRLARSMLGPQGGVEGLQAAGDIAGAGRRIAAAFDGRVGEILRLIGRDDSPRGADWAANLAAVDRLVRTLDGASNERVHPRAGPADSLGLLRLEDYLIAQARRTRADLWHDDRNEGPDYDRRVAAAYLDDAGELDGRMRGARRERIDAIRKGLSQPDEIRIAAPDRLIVTSEERAGLSYRLEADEQPDLRAGLAVAWSEGGRGFAIDRPADPSSRRAVPLGGSGSGPLEVLLRFPDDAPEAGPAPAPSTSTSPSTLLAHAYFRGRSLRREIPVERRPTPSRRIVHTPPPAGGGIVVRGDPDLIRGLGLGNGAVAIVLDASRSMWAPPDRPEPSKFREATEALRSVLSRMPPGTVVSLWAFGEAMGDPKTAAVAERTIRPLQTPVAWDPALLEPLMARVSAIEPWNESPILRTMLRAADDLRGSAGFKTLLVLTDGMDNRWIIDRELNPDGIDVATSLRSAFAGSDIAVNIVGYRVPTPAERERVRAQFEGVERFRMPGRFATAEASPDLIAALEGALRPALRFAIDGGPAGAVPPPSPLGFDVRPARAGAVGDPVRLAAGGFRLRLLTPDQPGCRFLIDDGDWLLARVVSTPAGPGFERELYSRVAFGLRPAVEEPRSGWRLAALQNRLVDGPGLRMTATFERRFDPRDPVLRVARPREIWFEVEAAGGGPSRAGSTIRVADRWGFPAPAWEVEVAGWPTLVGRAVPATPVLRAWWDEDEAAPAAVVERGRDFRANDDLDGQAADIDGRRVTIESVRVEPHEVEVGEGRRQRCPCLVVRLAYPKDDPCWARPYGIEFEGWEHRFYEDVGRYTGLFWPVTPAQADTAFRRLGLISVAAFRRRAESMRLDDLDPPDPRDVGPLPIGPSAPGRIPEPLARAADRSRTSPAGGR
jgi:hypothetical protein